eukprot:1404891-Amphidinium_carterae.1
MSKESKQPGPWGCVFFQHRVANNTDSCGKTGIHISDSFWSKHTKANGTTPKRRIKRKKHYLTCSDHAALCSALGSYLELLVQLRLIGLEAALVTETRKGNAGIYEDDIKKIPGTTQQWLSGEYSSNQDWSLLPRIQH